jgi:TRAP-type C4-dicarboxylate transport system substrate-binding protein
MTGTRALFAGASLAAALALFGIAGRAAEPVVLRVAHPNGPTHHMGRTLAAFADDVSARTKGAVVVQRRCGAEA